MNLRKICIVALAGENIFFVDGDLRKLQRLDNFEMITNRACYSTNVWKRYTDPIYEALGQELKQK